MSICVESAFKPVVVKISEWVKIPPGKSFGQFLNENVTQSCEHPGILGWLEEGGVGK